MFISPGYHMDGPHPRSDFYWLGVRWSRKLQPTVRYNGKMIPDTMKLLGVYDTSTNMQVFYSRSEYQKYLEQQSRTSGSGFGFYAGVKKAWGSSATPGSQKYLTVFDVDVDRGLHPTLWSSLYQSRTIWWPTGDMQKHRG